MNIFAKLLIIASLGIIIFGGGTFAAYELLFKRPVAVGKAGAQPVVTPTPDPVPNLLAEAKAQVAKGEVSEGKNALISLVRAFPKSPTIDEAKRALGDLNIREFFSPEPGPGKVVYVVVRGDSINRITRKTKAPEELLMRANGLETLRLQPGQRLVVPNGDFSLILNLKQKDVMLLDHGAFFRWYRPADFQLPVKLAVGQAKIADKMAWSGGNRVSFGDKKYVGSSRWIVINRSGLTLYSETNPSSPNVQAPTSGVRLTSEDMDELFALVTKNMPVTIE
jgi:LysM repeat protein